MTKIELIDSLSGNEDNDGIILLSDDALYTIASVTSVDGSILIAIEPLKEINNNDNRNNNDIVVPGGATGGIDPSQTLDVFGNLENVNIGG